MERSDTLQRLRGGGHHHGHHHHNDPRKNDSSTGSKDPWDLRHDRFPVSFIESTPENAQRIILWCLASDPAKRPTAEELLKVSFFKR